MKTGKIGLLIVVVFLSFDSLGLASLAYVWQAANLFKMDVRPVAESIQIPVKEKIQTSSLNHLFDYRSLRRIQTSA